MEIIKTNADVSNKKLLYKLTKSAALNVKDAERGTTFPVDAFALYDEEKIVKDGTTKTERVLSIISGDMKLATVSATFIKSFVDIVELMDGEPFAIIITGGTSKGGREYVDCELDCDM